MVDAVDVQKASRYLLTGDYSTSAIYEKGQLVFWYPETFSTSHSYVVGESCVHNRVVYKCITAHTGAWNASHFEAQHNASTDTLYRCITDIKVPESWTAAHWQATNINTEINRLRESEADTDMIAENYGDSNSYAVGDYVVHNSDLFRCVSAVSDTGSWDPDDWTQVKLANDVSDLKSAFDSTIGNVLKATTNASGLTYYTYSIVGGKKYVFRLTDVDTTNAAINLSAANASDQWVEDLAAATRDNPVVEFVPSNTTPKVRAYTNRPGTFLLCAYDSIVNNVNENKDDVDTLKTEVTLMSDVVDDIFIENIINTYPESNKSNFTTITNNNIYILENYIPKYETVKGIKLYAKSSGTLSLYFCTLDFVNHIATLVKKIDVTCSSGDNDVTFSEAFFAQEKMYIGIQGNGILSYRNTSVGDYGTVNNPHYESSSAITTVGVAFTENASAYFRYPVEIKSESSSFARIQMFENYATKEELAFTIPSGDLNRGNMLRYHQAESGEYTLWGRWFDMNVNGTSRKCTNNAGSEIMFSITGANSIVFTFDQATPNSVNPFMAFSVDGGEFIRQQLLTDNSLYKTTLTLSDNGDHIIRMSVDAISQTDSAYKWNGTNALALVSIVPNAGTMKAIVPMNKIGLFYGDSVTEGINVLSSGNTNTDQSATKAYSYWTARYLNSIRYCVGYGGSGMTQAGSFKPCIDAVNYMKNGIPTGILYPDYIVINHGINDYSGSASDFKAAYLIVINRLKIKYPGVPIFMVYPFMTTATNTKFVEGMTDIADNYTNVYFISTLGWNGETTDGTHLSVDGAKSDASKLSNELIKVLGKGFFIN